MTSRTAFEGRLFGRSGLGSPQPGVLLEVSVLDRIEIGTKPWKVMDI